MTEQYQQESINLAPDSDLGSFSNVVIVPWTGLSPGGTQSTYFVSLGTPINLAGDAASDWVVTPGTPGVSSDRIASSQRVGFSWFGQACFQSGPEAAPPKRAFLSAFYDPGAVAVGVTGCASGVEGNNDRADTIVFYGGLSVNNSLFFQISWRIVVVIYRKSRWMRCYRQLPAGLWPH